jgi:hypothetical protein
VLPRNTGESTIIQDDAASVRGGGGFLVSVKMPTLILDEFSWDALSAVLEAFTATSEVRWMDG